LDFGGLTKTNIVDLRIDPVKCIGMDEDSIKDMIQQKKNVLDKIKLFGSSKKVYICYLFLSDLLKNKSAEFYKHAMNPGLYGNRHLIESSA
jgi:hypothetical protein